MIALIEQKAEEFGLFVMGTLQDNDTHIVLLGAGSQMWPLFRKSPEHSDGLQDPLDRWSKRVFTEITEPFEASCIFPSDGPPYAPFIAWAQATGRFWQSPTGMLVHDTAGLMISIRGAIRLVDTQTTLPTDTSPCEACLDKPCVSACPVGALSDQSPYDVPACKAFLDTPGGLDCMEHGCKARRACPVSQSFGRDPEQSAFHMRSFHPS